MSILIQHLSCDFCLMISSRACIYQCHNYLFIIRAGIYTRANNWTHLYFITRPGDHTSSQRAHCQQQQQHKSSTVDHRTTSQHHSQHPSAPNGGSAPPAVMATTQQLTSTSNSRNHFAFDEQRVSRHQHAQRVEATPSGNIDLSDTGAMVVSQQISSRINSSSFPAGDSTSGQRRSQLQYASNNNVGPEVARTAAATSSSQIKSEPHEPASSSDGKNCGKGNDVVRMSVSSSPNGHNRSTSGSCTASKLMTSSSSSTSMISAVACREPSSTAAPLLQHGSDITSRQHQHLQQQQPQQPEVGIGAIGTGNSVSSFTVSSLVQSGGEFNGGGMTPLIGDTVSAGGHQLDMTGNSLMVNPHYHAAAMSAADRSDLSSLSSCFDPSSATHWFTSTGGQHGGCYSSSNARISSTSSNSDFYMNRLHQTMTQVAERPLSEGSPSSASSGYVPVHQTGYPTSAWYPPGAGSGPETNYGLSPTAGMFHDVFGDVTSAATRMLSAQQYMAAAAAAAAARQSCAAPGSGNPVMQGAPVAFRSYYGCSTPGAIGQGVTAGGGYQPYEDCSAKY